LFRTGLKELREIVIQTNPLFRRLLTVAVMAVVVVLVGLSTASRQPYTGTNNASWHTSKAGRMNPTSRKVGSETQALRWESDSERPPRSDRKLTFFALEMNAEEPSFVFGVDRFRSPPAFS
jgi:hypothetical protein